MARTAADCKMEMDADEYVESFRPGALNACNVCGVVLLL